VIVTISAAQVEPALRVSHLRLTAAEELKNALAVPVTALAIRCLYGQRECTAETAHLVRSTGIYDRRVLPRWHAEDTGWSNRHRGVHHRAPAGAYAHVRPWSGRARWLQEVLPLALTMFAPELKAAGISARTFTRWAEVETMYCADQRTGRRCVVRPITVAKVAGLGKSTVQKCRALAEALGLRVVVFRGRMLTVDECTGARARGSRQRGLSSEAAFTIPQAVENQHQNTSTETPTRGMRASSEKSPSRSLTYRGTSAETKETASPPRPERRRKCRDRRTVILARDLQAQVPWLRGSTLSAIIPTVHRFAVDPLMPWTAYDVITHMDGVNRRLGYTSLAQDFIRTCPAAVLAWYLRRDQVDPQADHPRMGAFLRGAAAEQRHPWCGTCDQVTRQVQVPVDTGSAHELSARCPVCHPLAGEPAW
jgi:hypothetical protein